MFYMTQRDDLPNQSLKSSMDQTQQTVFEENRTFNTSQMSDFRPKTLKPNFNQYPLKPTQFFTSRNKNSNMSTEPKINELDIIFSTLRPQTK